MLDTSNLETNIQNFFSNEKDEKRFQTHIYKTYIYIQPPKRLAYLGIMATHSTETPQTLREYSTEEFKEIIYNIFIYVYS